MLWIWRSEGQTDFQWAGGLGLVHLNERQRPLLEYGTLKCTSLETCVIHLTLMCDVYVRYMKRDVRNATGHMDARVKSRRHSCMSPMSVAVIIPLGCGSNRGGKEGPRTQL